MTFRPPDMRDVPVDIRHLDADLAVVHKPGGLLAVPGRGWHDSVTARIRKRVPDAEGFLAAHRLDMDTSGLMVLGLHPGALRLLRKQFEAGTIEKSYVALLERPLDGDGGCIDLPLRLQPTDRPRQVVDPCQGKPARTVWHRLEARRVRFLPMTGRTHQLRVHAADPRGLNNPICGDRLYGRSMPTPPLLLHAETLAFVHPGSGALMRFQAPAPF